MTRRLTVGLLAAGLLVAGCGGSSAERKALARYITAVNAVQVKLAQPLLTVSKANRDFATGHAKPASVERRLTSADRTIRSLQRQLAALTPPPVAHKLQSLLVQLVGREERLTREMTQMAVFFPRFGAALSPVAPASKALKSALAGKGKSGAKAAALERYGVVLAGVVERLRALRPPPVSVPVYESQLATIEHVRSSADALAQAVREKRSRDIPGLLRAFNEASIGNQTLAAQHAQIEAVRAYDARVRSLTTLASRIGRERNRLEKST